MNKQYTKEEYEELVPRIIESMRRPAQRDYAGQAYEKNGLSGEAPTLRRDGDWGEFLPAWLSPFGYNETIAQEYFPLTKEQAVAKGFNWSDYVAPKPDVKKTIPAAKLPDNIQDIPDDILNWAIECEVTGKPFRIVKPELKFYREHNLPIPRRHPDQRFRDRMALRNPRKLWQRQCDCNNVSHQHVPVETRYIASLQSNGNDHQHCPTMFQTTYAPDRPEIVYCEECYLKEVY